MTTHIPVSDLLALLRAIAAASPVGAERDRYGRLCGYRDTDQLRKLAVKYQTENGGQDSLDQAAMIARKMLLWDKSYTAGHQWAVELSRNIKLPQEVA